MTAVVAEDQLAIGPGRILGRETTRFGERLKLRDALVQPESEEPLEPFRQPRQALMAETLVARRRRRRRAPSLLRRWTRCGLAGGPPQSTIPVHE